MVCDRGTNYKGMQENQDITSGHRKLRIDALLLFGTGYRLEIFVRLSQEKFVKVASKEDSFESILEKYKNRGLTEVYLPLADYDYFTTSVRQSLISKLKSDCGLNPETPLLVDHAPALTSDLKSDKVPDIGVLAGAHDILKSLMVRENLELDTLELAQSLTVGTIKIIKQTNIMAKFIEFRKKCSREFASAVMTGQVACLMIDTFNWANDTIKEKVALASMLCDIELSPEDFDTLKDSGFSKEKLSRKIIHHPLETSAKLAKESKFFTQETLTIIEQHHELPSGGGFPKGLTYQRITQLTAIFIIAHYFVDQMFDKTYREDAHAERCKIVVDQIKNKFVSGVFRKASEALVQVFDRGSFS